MQVEVHRTIKNVFRARREGDKIVVLANWLLSLTEIKNILTNSAWLKRSVGGRVDDNQVCEKNYDGCHQTQSRCAQMQKSGYFFDCEERPRRESAEKIAEKTSDRYADMFCGKSVMLCGEVYEVCPSLITKTHLEDNKVFVYEQIFADKEERLKAVKAFVKRMARIYLSSEVSDFGTLAGLCPEKIDFRELKGEWTKCCDAVKRLVNIDFRVVQLPPNLRRYVIVHTFCHFSYPEHDEKFWNAVSNYLPNYIDYRSQLQQFEYLLEI